eukprot:Awhi_evm1s6805
MKTNEFISIIGTKVQLVPYEKQHVLKYHNWMKNEYLLETTCSEPLSLEAEYEMQISWRDDIEKCTFIVCDANNNDNNTGCTNEVDKTVQSMIGDVNLFVEDEPNRGQILIMIAEGIEEKVTKSESNAKEDGTPAILDIAIG